MHKVAKERNVQSTRRNIYIDDDQWDKIKLMALAKKWSVSRLIRYMVEMQVELELLDKGGDTDD